MDEQTIIDIWETFKDYVPEKNRDAVADQFLDFLMNQEIDTETIESLKGYDPHLDQAIESVLEDAGEGDDYDEGDNWDDEEEDEDY